MDGNIRRIARRLAGADPINRPAREVSREVRDAVAALGWEDFDRISRRGELNRDVLDRKLDEGAITPEQAGRLVLENDMGYYINELVTDLQVAEHDEVRRRWDSMSSAEQRGALAGLTPPPELKRKAFERLRAGRA